MTHPFPSLVSFLGGETLGIEYKRDLNTRNQRDGMEESVLAASLMAIGNANGGYLLLGIEDKTGKVLGVHPSRTGGRSKLLNGIRRKFTAEPPLHAHEERYEGKSVYLFYIEPAKQHPYQLLDGNLKLRKDVGNPQGPENLAFPLAELPQWQAQRGIHYDFSSALSSDLLWSEYERYLNPIALEVLRQRIAEGKTSPHLRGISSLEQQMDALGLVGTVDGRRVLNNAALILLGRNEILKERIPTHSAQFQALAADGSLPVNLTTGDPGLAHFSLLYLAVRIEELFRGVVPRREMMDGLFRIDIPAYGDDALREAVMNAFIHRDFTCPEPVIIQIMSQQCVITNPGGFYRDVSPENILFHEPCPRNQCLAHACVHLNLMERSGRGVDRIFWDQIRFMRQMPSYLDSTHETVRLNLQGGEGSIEAIRWMLDYFTEKDLRVRVVHGGLIHVLLSEGEASRDDLVAGLPGLNEQIGKRAITELINAGLMSRIGHGPGQRIVLSPQFLKRLGMPEAFVHQAGLESERQKHMILQYVDSHGSITRGEAARLLGMKADNTVYRLLDALVQEKRLERMGSRNKTKYHGVKV